jgi:hypothetical protein
MTQSARRHPGRPRRLTLLEQGHRKVWVRLHYGPGLPVGRDRVLRLMRDHQPLSPVRPPRPADDHGGTTLTEAPDVL